MEVDMKVGDRVQYLGNRQPTFGRVSGIDAGKVFVKWNDHFKDEPGDGYDAGEFIIITDNQWKATPAGKRDFRRP